MDNDRLQLTAEYAFFQSKLAEFVAEHPDKYVLIAEQKAIGFYDTLSDAVNRAVTAFTLGTFFIELCTARPDYYDITICGREAD